MARQEADREDLYSELTSCASRWELRVEQFDQPVLIGIRSDDRLSLFVGPDPVYHFDAQQRLRRAYVSGYLYRTQGHTLARLKRTRSENETNLLRHDLSIEELDAFQQQMLGTIKRLCEQLQTHCFTVLREQRSKPSDWQAVLQRLPICATNRELALGFPTRK